MTAVRIVRGNDERFEITVTDADGATYDLSGATVTCELKDSPGGTTLATATTEVTDAVNGVVTVTLSANTTAGLPLGPACFDLLVTDADGNKLTVPHDGPWWAEVVDPVSD